MADESRPLYKGPTPPSAGGETLFNILEEQRKQKSAIELLETKSEIKQKENVQETELLKTLEGLRSQNRMAEAKFTFDQSKAHEMMTNVELSKQISGQIQSLVNRGVSVPGLTEPTPPERAEHEPTSEVPIGIKPQAAPMVEKNLASFLSSYNQEQQAILRDRLGWITDEQIAEGTNLANELEQEGDPQSTMAAQLMRASSAMGSKKSDFAAGMRSVMLARQNNEARRAALKARLEGTSQLQQKLHTMDNEARLAIAKLQAEGTLAQLKTAGSILQGLSAAHNAMTNEIKTLEMELKLQGFRPEARKRINEEIAAKRRDMEAIAVRIQSYSKVMVDAETRTAPTQSTLSNRRQLEQDYRAIGGKKTFEWNKFGDDNIAVESTLDTAEKKKLRDYRRKQGR